MEAGGAAAWSDSGTQGGVENQFSEGMRSSPYSRKMHFPCAKSIFVEHVQRERESKRERQLLKPQKPSEWPSQH